MPDYMTKSTLLHANAGGGGDGGFGGARVAAANGQAGLEPVFDAIKSGSPHVWSGVGQPEATNVLHLNTLALDVTATAMDAGAEAVSALVDALVPLQVNLTELNENAKSQGFWVEEDGRVVYGANFPEVSADAHPLIEQKKRGLELAIKETLKIATAADLTAKASLELVARNLPSVTDTYSPGALDANKALLDQVLEDRQTIYEASAPFHLLDDLTLTTVEDLNQPGYDFGQVKENNNLLDKVIERLLTSKGSDILGPAVNLLKGDLSALLQANILTALEVSATLTPDEALAKLLRLPARVAGGVGLGLLALEVATAIAGKIVPDQGDTSQPVVDSNGEVKAHVQDLELAGLASSYYATPGGDESHDGSGTIADRARYQRINGIEPGDKDWGAEAKQTRSHLLAWLADNQDSPDAGYAQALVSELDLALRDVEVDEIEPIPEG